MEPLKQLRSKYSTKDLVIYSICGSEPKEEWEECLDKYSLRNRGIECIYANDFFTSQGIAISVGLNPVSLLTIGILGIGGFALLYGILACKFL